MTGLEINTFKKVWVCGFWKLKLRVEIKELGNARVVDEFNWRQRHVNVLDWNKIRPTVAIIFLLQLLWCCFNSRRLQQFVTIPFKRNSFEGNFRHTLNTECVDLVLFTLVIRVFDLTKEVITLISNLIQVWLHYIRDD